jgi:protein-S-isoprenylcysteine O-methyltransferase Ste14
MISPPNWLPLTFLITVVVSSAWRFAQLRAVHVNAFAFGGDGLKTLLERAFGILVATSTAFAIALAIDPYVASSVGQLPFLHQPLPGWIGAVLGVAGALLVAVAQFGMRASWRIGIRENEKSALVTSGLYRLSRNPIYFGMAAVLVGLFLIAPNAITLSLLASGMFAMSVQIRMEEAHLRGVHGSECERYCATTRRWI